MIEIEIARWVQYLVIYIRPFDSFFAVELLLLLDRKFDENRLQHLIYIIDAQLFEIIVVENLESKDI